MSTRDNSIQRAQLDRVRRILWLDWDPIGVNDTPEAFGEYDSYAAGILGSVLHGATAADLDFHLARIETDSMGLGSRPAPSRSRAVSKLLVLDSSEAVSTPADALAVVTLLATEDGGRTAPVQTGYRPHHRLLGKYQTSGTHTYLERNSVAPGESAQAYISFITPEAYLRSIAEGDVIEIAEGSKIVGHATILGVLNPILSRTG